MAMNGLVRSLARLTAFAAVATCLTVVLGVLLFFANNPQYRDAKVQGPVGVALLVFTVGFLSAAYMLPTIAAVLRQHQNSQAIAATNILLGWTVIGWAAALIWSFTTPPAARP